MMCRRGDGGVDGNLKPVREDAALQVRWFEQT